MQTANPFNLHRQNRKVKPAARSRAHRRHDDGGDDELVLERLLDLVHQARGPQVRRDEGREQRHDDAGSGDEQRERHRHLRVLNRAQRPAQYGIPKDMSSKCNRPNPQRNLMHAAWSTDLADQSDE